MMKYYVVSEDDLNNLTELAYDVGYEDGNKYLNDTLEAEKNLLKADFTRAKAVCQAREVPEWATHYTCSLIPTGDGAYFIGTSKEIKK